MKNLYGKTRREIAQAMVEFALVFPILLLVIYGIIEFGRLMFIYSAITTSSREAARYGSAAGRGAGVTIDLNSSKYNDCAGIRKAARRSSMGVSLPDNAINISYDSGPGTTKTSNSCPTPVFNLGDRVVVTVTVNYSPILPLPWLSDMPIRSTTGRTILKDIRVEGTPVALGDYIPLLYFFGDHAEIDEGGGSIEITVMLDTPSTDVVTAPIYLSGDAAPDDYVLSPTSVTIPAGDTYVRLKVTINDDAIDEYDEPLRLVLGTPTNADPGSPKVFTLLIKDNDDPPFISFQIPGQEVQEDAGNIAVPVILTDAAGALTYSGKPVTVGFSYAGTAVLGSDYTLSASPVAITPGQSAGFVLVSLIGPDRLDEEDETIQLNLTAPFEAVLKAPDQHTIIIKDVDVPKVFFSRAIAVVDETVARINLAVQLDIPSTQNLSVSYTLGGTATERVDYRISPNPVVIPAGSTSAPIIFEPIKDDESELPYETVDITLVKPPTAELGTPSQLQVQITDTYSTPEVSFAISTYRVSEKAGTFVLGVFLTRYANAPVTVPFSVEGTATTGTGLDDDYTFTPTGSLTIPEGDLESSITFTFIADGLDEDDESILVKMGAPVNAIMGFPNQTAITLEDADPTPGVYFNGVSKVVAEDVGVVSIPLSLSSPSSKTITVNFAVAKAPQTTAVENVDYVAFTNFTVTFPPKTTSATIEVTVLDNPNQDLDPRDLVLLLLNPPVNASLGTPKQYTLTIRDIQICPRFVSATQSNTLKTITLNIANDREFAKDVSIDSVTVTWLVDATQRVILLNWKDPDNLGTLSTDAGNGSPIAILGPNLWLLRVPGSTPPPPSTGYPLEVVFKNTLSPLSTYTVSVKFSNGCIRERSTMSSK